MEDSCGNLSVTEKTCDGATFVVVSFEKDSDSDFDLVWTS